MTASQKLFSLLFVSILCSCSNPATDKNEADQNDIDFGDSTQVDIESSADRTAYEDEMDLDTVTTLKFNELSVSISRLIIYDEDTKMDQIQKDTVLIYAELGETIEGQLVSIMSKQLTNIKVEQRYETSITIMNEGPHCDLTEWKHFVSDWKPLRMNRSGQFFCASYTKKESEQFPKINMNDLRQEVKKFCGEDWMKLIQSIKTPTEYPSGVSISRYYLRITGKRKDNGETVTKLIIIEVPMGC